MTTLNIDRHCNILSRDIIRQSISSRVFTVIHLLYLETFDIRYWPIPRLLKMAEIQYPYFQVINKRFHRNSGAHPIRLHQRVKSYSVRMLSHSDFPCAYLGEACCWFPWITMATLMTLILAAGSFA
jgi:hypothetical protein